MAKRHEVARLKALANDAREAQRVVTCVQYHQIYDRKIAELSLPDDDRYRMMRTPAAATDDGTGRSTVYHAINPGFASHLDRVRGGWSPECPPAPPRDRGTLERLGGAVSRPRALARARLALAQSHPDLSFVVEMVGFWDICSEHDLARAMSVPGVRGWERDQVHYRKYKACAMLRDAVLGNKPLPVDITQNLTEIPV